MPKVTVVGSAHRENGLCNVAQLLRVLQSLGPDVVFLEEQPSGPDPNWSLESKAIAKYSESAVVRRVIVDRFEVPASLPPDMQMVWNCVEQTSEEYLLLSEANSGRANRYGFEYLNSEVFAATRSRLSEIEDRAVGRMGDQRLIHTLASWRLVHQRREHDMVRSIYEYSRQNVFRTAAFLVGAAHKAGIVKEIGKYPTQELDSITWSIAYDVAIL